MSDAARPTKARPPQQVAIGLIQDAEAYRVAAERVCPKRARRREPLLLAPAWHLLCHASELTLKAYLLSDGADPSAKKDGLMHSAIRHNLSRLFQIAVERGFNPADEDFADVINFLSPYHGAHVFRYREEGRMPLLPPPAIADVLEPVIAGVASTVRARWLATQKPGQADEDLAAVGLARALPPSDLG